MTEHLLAIAVLIGGMILLLGLVFGRTFFAVLAALFVYDLIKLIFRLPFLVARWLRRWGSR